MTAASSATERSLAAHCCCDPADTARGRLPGARPPLRWWVPAGVFALIAFALTLVVVLVVRAPGPLDDPDPARQRNGLLVNGPALPAAVDGVRFGSRPVLVLFERRSPSGPAFDKWRSVVSDAGAELVVRVGRAGDQLARATRMPVPVDGGTPVGYALIDTGRRVRYATLDPVYVENAFEVDVVTRAVR